MKQYSISAPVLQLTRLRTLKHVAQYSPLLQEATKNDIARAPPQPSIKERFQRERLPLSDLPAFLSGREKLDVPVFTVWGACEDVSVLEKLRSGEYKIHNLHVIDESHSRLLDVGGVKLRLLGLGGAVVMHKLFDNGEGRTTIAGGQGTMWTTLLQMGELIDTANRVYDPSETRVFVTHASPAREGLLNQLSVTLKADFSISAGLHFRYGSSYNEFSVNPSLDHYRGKLSASKASFNDVWETVKHEVEPAVAENEAQNKLLQFAIDLVSKMPSVANGGNPFGGGNHMQNGGQVDESAFKNMWNFNLADAAFGWLVLDIDQGRIGTEMRAQGFNFSHRGGKQQQQHQQRPQAVPSAPSNASMGPTGGNLPTPQVQQPPPVQQNRPPPAQVQQMAQQPRPQQNNMQQPSPSQQQPKPAQQQPPQAPKSGETPQPSPALTTNGTTAPTATLPTKDQPQTNGTASQDAPKPTDTPVQNQQAPQQQARQNNFSPQQDSKAIFISFPMSGAGIATADEAKKELLADEDASKVVMMEKHGKNWVAHFNSVQERDEVMKKGVSSQAREKHGNLRMSVFRSRGGGFGGAGNWGSSRGGPNQRGGGEGRGGYQSATSGPTGSDSESGRGGRGRGGFRARGDRGRGGRGGRGDRGATGKDGATPTSGTPVPAAATAGGES